jgi:hypothetical protein
MPLLSRQRLAFNGFLPADASKAVLVRDLLMTAVRQSPLLSLVPDERLRDLLGKLNFPAALPADHAHLLAAATRDGIALVAEGRVVESGLGLRFALQIFEPGRGRPVVELAERAVVSNEIIPMADRVALELRREFGESPASLKVGYAPLEQVTSHDAVAVEHFYRGVRLYENSEPEAAILWFDRAIQIDDRFALAHL